MVVQVFGRDPKKTQQRLTRFYSQIVRFIQPRGELLGAFEHDALVGVLGTMRPGFCQPSVLDALRFMPTVVATTWPAAALRLQRWVTEWARHDPGQAHWHVGLLSVEPCAQGFGVGTKLMIEHCARMDGAKTISYLETDKAINVRFYRKFGYRVAGEAKVLGVSNWFMTRMPCAPR